MTRTTPLYSRGIASVAIIGVLAMGCAWAGDNKKTVIGGAGGATAGGLIAAAASGNPAAIAGGVILGGLLGGAIGNALDQKDKELAMKQAQQSLETSPTGQGGSWSNPDSGHSGTITPTRTYQESDGTHCREYRHDVVIDGKTQEATGTACRQADGTWKQK